MQETFDIYSIIIIVVFLVILVSISLFISKKKDFIKSHLKKNSLVDVVTSSLIGGGNKIVVFELYNKKYAVVLSRNNVSNILPLSEIKSIEKKHERTQNE